MASRGLPAACLFALSLATLGAQAKADIGADSAAAGNGTYCYFRLDAEGKPAFTQVLRWEADPNALEYRILIKDSSGSLVFDQRARSSRVEVQLKPGVYEYRILSYNLLEKVEAEGPWKGLEIAKAELPAISSVFPKILSLDSLDGRVTVRGSNLLDKATVTLVSPAGERYRGTIKERKGDGELVIDFPDGAIKPGIYDLCAENPGGLSATFREPLRVRLLSPFDVLASTGYAPLVALYDRWFVDGWSANFHPQGLDARLQILFVKLPRFSFGMEIGAEQRRMSADLGDATLTSDFTLAGAGFLYAYRLTRRLHALARLDAGYSMSYHGFDYTGYPGPRASSFDPFARVGIALQAFLPWNLYGEVGADLSCISLLGHYALGISPSLRAGYKLY